MADKKFTYFNQGFDDKRIHGKRRDGSYQSDRDFLKNQENSHLALINSFGLFLCKIPNGFPITIGKQNFQDIQEFTANAYDIKYSDYYTYFLKFTKGNKFKLAQLFISPRKVRWPVAGPNSIGVSKNDFFAEFENGYLGLGDLDYLDGLFKYPAFEEKFLFFRNEEQNAILGSDTEEDAPTNSNFHRIVKAKRAIKLNIICNEARNLLAIFEKKLSEKKFLNLKDAVGDFVTLSNILIEAKKQNLLPSFKGTPIEHVDYIAEGYKDNYQQIQIGHYFILLDYVEFPGHADEARSNGENQTYIRMRKALANYNNEIRVINEATQISTEASSDKAMNVETVNHPLLPSPSDIQILTEVEVEVEVDKVLSVTHSSSPDIEQTDHDWLEVIINWGNTVLQTATGLFPKPRKVYKQTNEELMQIFLGEIKAELQQGITKEIYYNPQTDEIGINSENLSKRHSYKAVFDTITFVQMAQEKGMDTTVTGYGLVCFTLQQ